MDDRGAECSFSRGNDRKKVAIYSYESNFVDAALFVDVIKEFQKCAVVRYGHAFIRPFNLGPAMYAHDLIYGLDEQGRREDASEAKEMALWYQERLDMVAQNKPALFRHLQGMQRDVYPLNVLTRVHLEREIGGKPLHKWIDESQERGTLHNIANGVWIWTVPPTQVYLLQMALSAAGLLISRPRGM